MVRKAISRQWLYNMLIEYMYMSKREQEKAIEDKKSG
jgi:hypothetical protein